MSTTGQKIPDYPALTGPTSNTILVASHNANGIVNTYSVTLTSLLTNSASNVALQNAYALNANTVVITKFTTPANSTSTNVVMGTIWSDNTYVYVATANNEVKRVALASF